MGFVPGAHVVVLTLGRKRGIVMETGRGGRYRVLVDNATISCREEDLSSPPEVPGRARRARQREDTARARSVVQAAPPGRVDLHGLTVEEALARVVEEIDRGLRRGSDRMEVVHGKGSGRIRDALHRQLSALSVVKAFQLDPGNPGVTWVYF